MSTPRFVRSLILVLVASSAWGAIVSRPVKTCGTTNFSTESAAGCKIIKSAEVDSDLNTIFSDYNGNITNANVQGAANILGSKLADGTVTSAKVTDGTLVNADINAAAGIVGTKLAVGATVNAETSLALPSPTSAAAETTIVQLPGLTTRGGKVLLFGTGGMLLNMAAGSNGTVTLRVYRDAVVLATVTTPVENLSTGGIFVPMALPTWRDAPVAGTYVYKFTAQTSGAPIFINTNNANSGTWFALELS